MLRGTAARRLASASIAPMRLVLFDVDGTLLTCGGQVRPIFAAALAETLGVAVEVDGYSFAGRTDQRIVLDLAARAGVGEERARAALPRVREAFVARLAAGLDPAEVTVLPGVVALLDRLAADPETEVGLLTGNWRRGAEIKLAAAGLPFDRFRCGAFGDDGVERGELPPVALARAAAVTGRAFRPEEVLIVGDSPADVACARAHGLACLAVATGWTPAAELTAAGASWVAADLTAPDALARFAASDSEGDGAPVLSPPAALRR